MEYLKLKQYVKYKSLLDLFFLLQCLRCNTDSLEC